MEFDGTDDFMDLGTGIVLNGAYGVTFAAWVRFDSFPGTAYLLSLKASDGKVLRIYNGGTSQKMTTLLSNDGSTDHEFGHDKDDVFGDAGLWTHVAVTITGLGGIKHYKNGYTSSSWTNVGFGQALAPEDVAYEFAAGGASRTRTEAPAGS